MSTAVSIPEALAIAFVLLLGCVAAAAWHGRPHRIRVVARCCGCAARFTSQQQFARLARIRNELSRGISATCSHCHTRALVLRPGCATPAVGVHIGIGLAYPEDALS